MSETRYEPYGQAYWQWGATSTDFGFTGQRMDGFGLMDYNARYYDPYLARFISPDTLIPQPGNPLAWDRYAYTSNNPINRIDPSGHKACSNDGNDFDSCEDPLAISAEDYAELFGIVFDGSWTEANQWSVLIGSALTGTKYGNELGMSSNIAFKTVYSVDTNNPFVFGWGNCPECNGAGGYTYGSKLIRFESLWRWNPDQRIPNVIHELGHSFNNLFWTTLSSGSRIRLPDYLLGRAQSLNPFFPDRPDNADRRLSYGFAGPFGFFQQSRQGSTSEEFADSFVGWVYNQWEDSMAGTIRQTWMDNLMAVMVNLAAK